MPPSDPRHRLHAGLRAFYAQHAAYYAAAERANRALTPERAHLFGYIHPGERLLDVGCGSGENGWFLAERGRYVGCDLSFLALQRGQAEFPAGQVRLIQAESHALPFATHSFGVVLSTYALEHFVYPRESLAEMWRVCGRGGRLILAAPAYDDPRRLPPSTGHWRAGRRLGLVLRQAWRQGRRHLDAHYFAFACVDRPRVLEQAYESDFDAVHLVSAREIGSYLRALGAELLFERKRQPRPIPAGVGLIRRLREHVRNGLLRLHLGEYAGLNLQLVARKPE